MTAPAEINELAKSVVALDKAAFDLNDIEGAIHMETALPLSKEDFGYLAGLSESANEALTHFRDASDEAIAYEEITPETEQAKKVAIATLEARIAGLQTYADSDGQEALMAVSKSLYRKTPAEKTQAQQDFINNQHERIQGLIGEIKDPTLLKATGRLIKNTKDQVNLSNTKPAAQSQRKAMQSMAELAKGYGEYFSNQPGLKRLGHDFTTIQNEIRAEIEKTPLPTQEVVETATPQKEEKKAEVETTTKKETEGLSKEVLQKAAPLSQVLIDLRCMATMVGDNIWDDLGDKAQAKSGGLSPDEFNILKAAHKDRTEKMLRGVEALEKSLDNAEGDSIVKKNMSNAVSAFKDCYKGLLNIAKKEAPEYQESIAETLNSLDKNIAKYDREGTLLEPVETATPSIKEAAQEVSVKQKAEEKKPKVKIDKAQDIVQRVHALRTSTPDKVGIKRDNTQQTNVTENSANGLGAFATGSQNVTRLDYDWQKDIKATKKSSRRTYSKKTGVQTFDR